MCIRNIAKHSVATKRDKSEAESERDTERQKTETETENVTCVLPALISCRRFAVASETASSKDYDVIVSHHQLPSSLSLT